LRRLLKLRRARPDQPLLMYLLKLKPVLSLPLPQASPLAC
jgi:hypothetical protein